MSPLYSLPQSISHELSRAKLDQRNHFIYGFRVFVRNDGLGVVIPSASWRIDLGSYNQTTNFQQYIVYILGNDRPTLYIGITSNLAKRMHEHKSGAVQGFTQK